MFYLYILLHVVHSFIQGVKYFLVRSCHQLIVVYPKGVGPEAPAWVAFDRQVLCFDAYFQEAVHEKREEQYRIRKYVSLYL